MSEIEKGSVVMLKSGGPCMTVLNVVSRASSESAIICVWFDKNDVYKNETFASHLLKVIE